jgi:hypothetical protein
LLVSGKLRFEVQVASVIEACEGGGSRSGMGTKKWQKKTEDFLLTRGLIPSSPQEQSHHTLPILDVNVNVEE